MDDVLEFNKWQILNEDRLLGVHIWAQLCGRLCIVYCIKSANVVTPAFKKC